MGHDYLLGLCCIKSMQTAGSMHNAMTGGGTASSFTSPLRYSTNAAAVCSLNGGIHDRAVAREALALSLATRIGSEKFEALGKDLDADHAADERRAVLRTELWTLRRRSIQKLLGSQIWNDLQAAGLSGVRNGSLYGRGGRHRENAKHLLHSSRISRQIF